MSAGKVLEGGHGQRADERKLTPLQRTFPSDVISSHCETLKIHVRH